MKFALAYYLLLIYATVILKALIPLAENKVSHCFSEAYHIATVHAKYGNNHLEKQMADTNDDSNSKTKNLVKAEDIITAYTPSAEQTFNLKSVNPCLSYYNNFKTGLQKLP